MARNIKSELSASEHVFTLPLPFNPEAEYLKVWSSSREPLPALIRTSSGTLIRPQHQTSDYIRLALSVSRLSLMSKHLWIAGVPLPARPLHRQLQMKRRLVVTEQTDLHLVWTYDRIFVKPLPSFLLDGEVWDKYILGDEVNWGEACGFLLSYAWMVSYPSDLQIAKEADLLPKNLEWEAWSSFVDDFTGRLEQHAALNFGAQASISSGVNKRYHYGELRLTRLNLIKRFPAYWGNESTFHFMRGYYQDPAWYGSFLQRNFGWLAGAFGYVVTVLSAMQVGLATQRLGQNSVFQNVSYGFTVFSILVPVIATFMVIVWSFVSSAYHVQQTLNLSFWGWHR